MKVLLVRSGQRVEGGAEAHRHLTVTGRQATRAVGRRLHGELEATGDSVTAVLAAPTVGAAQTAELLAERLDYVGVVEAAHWLLPGIPAHVAAAEVVLRDGLVVLVGDEPGLSELAAALVGRPTFPPLLPSQASLVDGRRGRWTLRPDTLERVDLVLE